MARATGSKAARAPAKEPVRTAGPLLSTITRSAYAGRKHPAKALYVPVVRFTLPTERKSCGSNQRWQAPIMSRYAGAALIIMYACTEQHHDSAALHHRAMEVESKK
ncbi:hypothetical protein [Paenibacillus sp. CH40]|uniref:hypothetical protein n=1 Tax=Paenibacillus sp. CH40 TaxID=2962045 RepID=UPI0020B8317B|nr:hypothetical protein [Paenibacillus sp. CH40]MCP3796425.1 hypothetical protein [Paenibacillus sp. CH40]